MISNQTNNWNHGAGGKYRVSCVLIKGVKYSYEWKKGRSITKKWIVIRSGSITKSITTTTIQMKVKEVKTNWANESASN